MDQDFGVAEIVRSMFMGGLASRCHSSGASKVAMSSTHIARGGRLARERAQGHGRADEVSGPTAAQEGT